jgi:hypothetical protein
MASQGCAENERSCLACIPGAGSSTSTGASWRWRGCTGVLCGSEARGRRHRCAPHRLTSRRLFKCVCKRPGCETCQGSAEHSKCDKHDFFAGTAAGPAVALGVTAEAGSPPAAARVDGTPEHSPIKPHSGRSPTPLIVDQLMSDLMEDAFTPRCGPVSLLTHSWFVAAFAQLGVAGPPASMPSALL